MSIRTLPTTAFFGNSLVFFYCFAALLFLIPVALVSAECSSRYSDAGGVFHWVRYSFGSRIGVLAVWLQWINTMVWYPTMLLFIAGSATYFIRVSFSISRIFFTLFSLGIFWGLTYINLKRIQISVRMNAFCAMIGIFHAR